MERTLELTDDLRAAHADLSAVDLAFREHALRTPELLRRSTFSSLEEPHPLLRYKRQSWPTFIGPEKVREISELSVGLSELIRSVPERFFCNDPRRIGEFFEVDPPMVELALAPPSGIDVGMSRGDLIATEDGFRCLEFNMTSSLGGWETGILAEMLFAIPPVRRFLDEADVEPRVRDTARIMLMCVIRDVMARSVAALGSPVNVIVGMREAWDVFQDPDIQGYLSAVFEAALREVEPGLEGWIGALNYTQLGYLEGRLRFRERVLHAVIERHGPPSDDRTFRASKSGRLLLYNGPASFVLSDKRNLAVLSEHQESDLLSAAERDLVARNIPWTRMLQRGEVDYHGETIELPEVVLADAPRWVIKKARSLGGRDVLVGRFTDPDEWAAGVAKALADGDWLVQEFIPSRAFLYQAGDEGCCPHDVIWGPFVIGSTYAGTILRMQPKAAGGIVNLTREATEGVLLEVEG